MLPKSNLPLRWEEKLVTEGRSARDGMSVLGQVVPLIHDLRWHPDRWLQQPPPLQSQKLKAAETGVADAPMSRGRPSRRWRTAGSRRPNQAPAGQCEPSPLTRREREGGKIGESYNTYLTLEEEGSKSSEDDPPLPAALHSRCLPAPPPSPPPRWLAGVRRKRAPARVPGELVVRRRR